MLRPSCLFLCLSWAMAPSFAVAQDPPKKIPDVEIKQARIGFLGGEAANVQARYKIGMWTPVYVKIKAGTKGIHPKAPGDPEPYIQVENDDAEDVGTIYRTPFRMDANEERWITTYAKSGRMSDIKIKVVVGDQWYQPPFASGNAFDLNAHFYLSLGDRIPDLSEAVRSLNQQGGGANVGINRDPNDPGPRHAGFEADFDLLPERWYGYHGVDVLFLSTRDKDFLLKLGKDNDAGRERLRAIAQYVRRGGRLVIGIAPRNSDVLHQLLMSPVWQPAVPVVPPREGVLDTKRLTGVEAFAGVVGEPFSGKAAVIQPAKMVPGAWEVLAPPAGVFNPETDKPLMVRIPYGLGSITLLSFPLDEAPFSAWGRGKVELLKKLVMRVGPRVGNRIDQGNDPRGLNDLSTDLQKSLDNFDVRVIPFGYVALFIVLYIIVVGPLDYLVLKYVFKRLEWTWFTFPTVVFAVSVAAYFTAYAIKGNDLKINKVDLIDIDQRTGADAKGQSKKAAAYGQTFFTILSPQIKNYTIGVEPNSLFWGQKSDKQTSADMVTWLGRPDTGMFGGMGGRGGGQGFFRKPYRYAADATGLIDVPIPVWTTKSIHASWEALNIPPPIASDLSYSKGNNWKVTGTLANGLGVDLEDVWIFHFNRYFPIAGGLARGAQLKVSLEQGQEKSISNWTDTARDSGRIQTAQGLYNPSSFLRYAQFHERIDQGNNTRNHSLRALDQSWRRLEETVRPRDDEVREAILVARVKFTVGDGLAMNKDDNPLLPTRLWLGALPGVGAACPELNGTLAQDTFVRVLLAVRPQE